MDMGQVAYTAIFDASGTGGKPFPLHTTPRFQLGLGNYSGWKLEHHKVNLKGRWALTPAFSFHDVPTLIPPPPQTVKTGSPLPAAWNRGIRWSSAARVGPVHDEISAAVALPSLGFVGTVPQSDGSFFSLETLLGGHTISVPQR